MENNPDDYALNTTIGIYGINKLTFWSELSQKIFSTFFITLAWATLTYAKRRKSFVEARYDICAPILNLYCLRNKVEETFHT